MLRVFVSRFVTALVLCVMLAAGGVAGAYWFANNKWDDVTNARIPENFFTHVPKGKPANYLIIGSDTRAFVNNSADASHFGTSSEEGGQRSDTIMVAHIDPDSNHGMLVSFPRDLKVNVPGRGYTRINSAFNDAIAEHKYRGSYRGVFPIKVNQLREVVEEILDAGRPFNYGLEVGSKPEMFAGLAIHNDPDGVNIPEARAEWQYVLEKDPNNRSCKVYLGMTADA